MLMREPNDLVTDDLEIKGNLVEEGIPNDQQ
jgi:hypothetical protein